MHDAWCSHLIPFVQEDYCRALLCLQHSSTRPVTQRPSMVQRSAPDHTGAGANRACARSAMAPFARLQEPTRILHFGKLLLILCYHSVTQANPARLRH
jgi:hypothetical protein